MRTRSVIGAVIAMSLLAPISSVCSVSAEYTVGWDEPVLAETYDLAGVSDPECATDGNGSFMAVWIQFESPGSSISAALCDRDHGWLDAELIEYSSEEVSTPKVAMNEAGNAVAAWAQMNDSTSKRDVWSNRYMKGVGWLGPERVEDNSSAEDRVIAVAMDGADNAMVVWTRYETAIDVMASKYEVGAGWGDPVFLDDNEMADSSFPSVTVTGDDDFIVVWSQWEMSQPSICAKRYDAAEGWEDAEELSDNGVLAQPQVVAGDGGDALCTWHHMDGTGFYEVWCCAYEAGVGWSAPAVMGSNANTNHYSPRVAIDGEGNGAVVWIRSGGMQDGIYSRFYDASEGWGENVTVSSDYYGDVYLPDVAMNSDGDTLCIFARDNGDSDDMRGAVRNPEGGWLPSEQLTKEALGNIFRSRVVIGDDGNGIALWCQDDGSKVSLWSARYLGPDETPPDVFIESPEDGAAVNSTTIVVSGQTEQGAHLVVNGIVVGVEQDGSFSCVIALVEGENTITATATDAADNSASASVTVTREPADAALMDELEEALESLDETKDDLADAREDLEDANERIDTLASQIMVLGIAVAAFALVSIVSLAMYLGLRRKAEEDGGADEGEVPPPPE
ncbi:MAG: hypothetical protein JSV90_04585 [Methanobacteriota archaeon]|nr:MAG: hypothetical protein JSV90_04585 [Euryarchaeota archaeon]